MVTDAVNWWAQQGCLILHENFASLNDDEMVWKNFKKVSEEQQTKSQSKGDVDEDSEEEDIEDDDDGDNNPRVDRMESFWEYTKNMVLVLNLFFDL